MTPTSVAGCKCVETGDVSTAVQLKLAAKQLHIAYEPRLWHHHLRYTGIIPDPGRPTMHDSMHSMPSNNPLRADLLLYV